MERIYTLVPDKRSWEVTVKEIKFAHSAHYYCQHCGKEMKFDLREHSPKYSGYTRNVVLDVFEVCPNGCEEFLMKEVYRNRFDELVYTHNFTELEEYKERMLERSK